MFFIGVDIGTTNTKAVLIDSDLEIRDRLTIQNAVPSGSKRLADIYYSNFCNILGHFNNSRLICGQKVFCSITSQGGSFLLLDSENQPLTPIRSWTEQAKKRAARHIAEMFDEEWYYHTTGWTPNAWMAVCKLMELRNTMGRAFKRVARFVTIPDYIHSRLGVQITTDVTNAQMTGMCNFNTVKWSSKICEHIGISPEILPAISDRLRIVEEVSTPWGNITLVTSSHDQYAAMAATSMVEDKSVLLATGTVWGVNMLTSKPLYDESTCLVHPGRDLHKGQFGCIYSLGPPGPVGKQFENLLSKLDADQAVLSQITNDNQRSGFPRRVIEGIDLECSSDTKTAVQRFMEWTGSRVRYTLEERKIKPSLGCLLMTGGAVKSPLWPQLIADICNISVKAIEVHELTAYGAAIFAFEGATGKTLSESVLDKLMIKHYVPQFPHEYQDWYRNHQYPMLETSLSKFNRSCKKDA